MPDRHMLFSVAVALCLLPLGAIPSHAGPNPAVSSFTLENGMRGVVIEDRRAPVVTHMVWYPVGSADEPPGVSGIAHFLEHLMFKSPDEEEDGAFSKIVAANGGRDNAFTSYDYTAYFQTIAADRLDLVMKMEADRMRDLVISEEDVETERQVIIEERNQRTENSPQRLFGEQVNAALYQNHRYGVPIIGWRHEMEQLSRADALAFYERYYAPDNAILVVAGDVDAADVERLANQHYGPLEPSGRPPEARPSEPPQRAERRLRMEDPRVRQPYVVRKYLVPSRGSGDPRQAAALELLANVLGAGVTSRFTERLEREDKIAVDSGAYYFSGSRDDTEFTIYGVSAEGVGLDVVEAALDEELARIRAEGPTEDELERIKRLYKADAIYARDSHSSEARRYGRGLSAGLTIEEIDTWPDMIGSITVDEVREAAGLLDRRRSVTGWLEGADEGEQG